MPIGLLRRAIACLVAASVVLGSAPAMAAATSTTHRACAQKQHECSQPRLVRCCCGHEQPPAPPARVPDRQFSSGTDRVTQLPPAVMPLNVAVPGTRTYPRSTPPHGYRSVDLPILLSTFLV